MTHITMYKGIRLDCSIYSICKWAENEQKRVLKFIDSSLIWEVTTRGYEKHIIDVARQDRRTLYILTALRIIKTYFFRKVTVLKSYHLKQIALYLIFFLCHYYPHYKTTRGKDGRSLFYRYTYYLVFA